MSMSYVDLNQKQLAADLEQAQNYLMSAGEIIHRYQCLLKPLKTETTPTPPATTPQKTQSPYQQANANQTNTQNQTKRCQNLNDIRHSYPEDLQSRLEFTLQDKTVYIKPKTFLGSENFAKIINHTKHLGGKYVSAGKQSHFEVPL